MRKNIDQMALSPNGTLLVTVDKGKQQHFFLKLEYNIQVNNVTHSCI